MNLALVHKPLIATTQQRRGSLKVASSWADREVAEMVEAGLVEATVKDGKKESVTVITRVTAAGEAFLRAFEGYTFPAGSNSRLQKGSYWER